MTQAAQASPAPVVLETGYVPRPLQAQLHMSLRRFNVLVAHRRFGKTVFCINHLIAKALRCPLKRPFYAYVAPFRNQAKDIAWPYLKEYTQRLPNVEYNEAELRVTLPGGATIKLFGADNPDALRGLYFDGVIFDEYAQQNSRMWSEIVFPAMTDRPNSWAVFIGTPCGHDQFYDIYQQALSKVEQNDPNWFAAAFKASQTGIISPEALKLARENSITETGDEDTFLQEFEISFEAAIKGAYYGKAMTIAQNEGRILPQLANEPTLPVHTAWDLGVGDSTAIWFFRVTRSGFIDIIDYYENNGVGMEHYLRHLKSKDYTYGNHYVPHDAVVREWGSGKTRLEQAQSLGFRFRVVPRVTIEDGINAVRAILPKCRFDKTKCKVGIEHLKNYKQKYDPARKTFSNAPEHGPASHGADAMRYLALGIRNDYDHIPVKSTKITACEPTLNELLSEHDDEARQEHWKKRI